MKFLREISEEIDYITEAKEGSGEKDYYIEGIFMQGDVRNRNGRTYPSEVLRKEAKKYMENYIDKRRAFGELGHPNSPSLNLDRSSHLITSLKESNSNFVGKAKVLNTPNGKIVKSLMDEKCLLGVSTRGLGSIKESRGEKIVQSDFFLITAGDIVHDPSGPDCWMDNIVENVEWIFDGVDWRVQERAVEKIQEVKDNEYKPSMSKAEKETLFLEAFGKFLGKV